MCELIPLWRWKKECVPHQNKTYHSFVTPRSSSSMARMPVSTSFGMGSSLFTVMRFLICSVTGTVNFDSGSPAAAVLLTPLAASKSLLITTFSPLRTRRILGHTITTSSDTATPIEALDRRKTWTTNTAYLLVNALSKRKRLKAPHAHLDIRRRCRLICERFKWSDNTNKNKADSCSLKYLIFLIKSRRQVTRYPCDRDRQEE